jgi:hypothetical protein
MFYSDDKWFINNDDVLVINSEEHGEIPFKIYSMSRMGRRLLKGERKDWWSFNASKVIVAEENFDWEHPGLKNKLANRSKEMMRDPEEARSIKIVLNQLVRTSQKSCSCHKSQNNTINASGKIYRIISYLFSKKKSKPNKRKKSAKMKMMSLMSKMYQR